MKLSDFLTNRYLNDGLQKEHEMQILTDEDLAELTEFSSENRKDGLARARTYLAQIRRMMIHIDEVDDPGEWTKLMERYKHQQSYLVDLIAKLTPRATARRSPTAKSDLHFKSD